MPFVSAKFLPTKHKMGPTKKTWFSMTSIQSENQGLPDKTGSLTSLSTVDDLPKTGSSLSLSSESSKGETPLTKRPPTRGRIYQRKQGSSQSKITAKTSSSKLLVVKTGSLSSLSPKHRAVKTGSLVSLSSNGKTGSPSSLNGRFN